jgi:hypothetical protein
MTIQTEQIGLRLKLELVNKLRSYCADEGRSQTWVIDKALNQYLSLGSGSQAIATFEPNPNGILPITHNLKPNNPCKNESKIPVCPHDKIIDLYHKILPELQGVNKTLWKGSKREKDLSSRWKQNEEFRKGEFWDWFFKNVRTSNHHMGGSEGGWKAELGWLVKKENFIKLVERFSS